MRTDKQGGNPGQNQTCLLKLQVVSLLGCPLAAWKNCSKSSLLRLDFNQQRSWGNSFLFITTEHTDFF